MSVNVAIGVQDFSTLIENHYFYVDKTAFLKEWWDSGDSVTLITRPRRFGKTLTMSMTEQFFSMEYAGRSDLFEELEEQLLIADVGVETTRKIIANLTEGASRKQLRDAEALYGLLKDEMGEILAKVDEPLNIEGKMPFVILMVGVNGVGKTTTIGKLAARLQIGRAHV